MSFEMLKVCFEMFRLDEISRDELKLAIGLWQRKAYGRIA
jgi:hypothetical protein